ncbi:MAG: FAD-dependent oxidoreductase [Paludibacter sp.]
MGTISKATVLSIKEHGSEIKEYSLRLEKNHYFEAGSFLQLTLENKEDYTRWPDSRNFSIASAYNEDGTVKLIIRKVGKYTTRIFDELKTGKSCTVKYAFGDFLLPFFDKKNPICCIAGGTGVAPILSFCEQLKREKQLDRLHVYYSFKNEDEQQGIEILKLLVPENQLHLFCTRQKIEGLPNKRINFSDILGSGLDLVQSHFYICGGEIFTSYFTKNLTTVGAENIYTDEW